MKKIISLICALMVVSGMALAQRGEPVVILCHVIDDFACLELQH